ncbi:kinase-like protein [Peniophora sp. CONT]|nr:kinase-like protein [Peniophora sp. CONT]
MPLLRNWRLAKPDRPVAETPIGVYLHHPDPSASSIPVPKRASLGAALRDHFPLRRRPTHQPEYPVMLPSAASSSVSVGTSRPPSSPPRHKIPGTTRGSLSLRRRPAFQEAPSTSTVAAAPISRPPTTVPGPNRRTHTRHRNKTPLKVPLLHPSLRKPLPPIPGSPSQPEPENGLTPLTLSLPGPLDLSQLGPIENIGTPHPGPLPLPPLEQLPIHASSSDREETQSGAMGFSPAQARHIIVPAEQEGGVPNDAPPPGANLGPPPGLYKQPQAAARQDGLPYAILPAVRRRFEPPGMNPPPLGSTCVELPGVGSDGKPLRINFDFLGLLSSDRQIFGALARPTSRDLVNFPRFVAVKMLRKSELVADNEKYIWVCVEVESMKRLAGKDFVNGALAVFQDGDFVYIVSKWYAGDVEEYIKSWNEQTVISFPSVPRGIGLRRMPPEVFRFYAGELLLAMNTLRDLNIVHGDVKPQNVFVSPSGHLELADFDHSFVDVSRAMREQNCAYEDVVLDAPSGTTPYMAPELLQDVMWHPRSQTPRGIVTPRADLWSLGMTLLEFALGAVFPGRYVTCKFHEGFFDAMLVENVDPLSFRSDLTLQQRYARVMDEGHLVRCADFFHPEVHAFICKLLSVEPAARGSIPELMQHPIFADMNWYTLRSSVPKLVELGACEPQERAKLVPLNAPPARPRPITAGGDPLDKLFPTGMALTLSYDQFSDWIAPCEPADSPPAHDKHGLVVPVMQLPLQPVPHMGK